MRPIDADKATEVVGYFLEQMGIALFGINGKDLARTLLLRVPTIDAVSVVHGEWKPNPKIGWGETWVCSICGEKTTSSVMGYPRYRYCPMCGAKMYKENE